ncbi:MAG: hypothetical protein VYE73_00660 [Acidobacteriota bacterium]|nr:hypothetical protein [Acidobacteriota bacterium]
MPRRQDGGYVSPRRARASWALLAGLCLVLGYLSLTFDRDRWPGFVGDEASYLMAAESVAFDLDYRFEAADLERFESRHQQDGIVVLQSGDGGQKLAYGKPPFYPIALAPFVRVLGMRGAAVANTFYLSAALILAAWALSRNRHVDGPLWVCVFVFGSVAFGHVFWVQSDLFLLSCTAAGLALGTASVPRRATVSRAAVVGQAMAGLGAGLLLAVPVVSRPNYLLLLVAPALLVGVDRRRLWGFALGTLMVAALAVGLHQASSGSPSPYGGERRGFSRETGFPAGPAAVDWSAAVAERGDTSWFGDSPLAGFQPRLLAWNAYYFLAGQKIGLLAYFLPAIVTFPLWSRRRSPWIAWMLVGLMMLSFFGMRPFNIYGGAGALANRYFLPVYPLLWFALPLRLHPRWGIASILASTAFLFPLWRDPRAFPVTVGESYRYVSPVAARLLPIETTQRHLGPPQVGDVYHAGLWMRPLSGALRASGEGQRLLFANGSLDVDVLVGYRGALDGILLSIVSGEVGDVGSESVEIEPEGAKSWRIELGDELARHPMWWTADDVWLYRLRFRLAGDSGPVALTMRPVE